MAIFSFNPQNNGQAQLKTYVPPHGGAIPMPNIDLFDYFPTTSHWTEKR